MSSGVPYVCRQCTDPDASNFEKYIIKKSWRTGKSFGEIETEIGDGQVLILLSSWNGYWSIVCDDCKVVNNG